MLSRVMNHLPIPTRKKHWTPTLKQQCRLLEHDPSINLQVTRWARNMPGLVKGKISYDPGLGKMKVSTCSLPLCERNDLYDEKKFQVCGACGLTRYCSKEHQVEHWKKHKPICKKSMNLNKKKNKVEILKRFGFF